MKIKRIVSTEDYFVEVAIEDFPDDGESREVFEERMVRIVERLQTPDSVPTDD